MENGKWKMSPREINRHLGFVAMYRQFSDHSEIALSLSLPCNDALWGSAASAPSVRAHEHPLSIAHLLALGFKQNNTRCHGGIE